MSAPPIPPRPLWYQKSYQVNSNYVGEEKNPTSATCLDNSFESMKSNIASAAEEQYLEKKGKLNDPEIMLEKSTILPVSETDKPSEKSPSSETIRKCTMANLNQLEAEEEWKIYCGKERAFLRRRRTRMRVSNFHIITQVGQGGYGEVFLARKQETNEICALKRMSKRLLSKLGEKVQHVLTERDILTRTETPWLVKLLYAFQDIEHVYLAMEYVPGGDVRTLLNNYGVLREEHARFYVAEMIMCVSELHRLGYIHRDLKPENFLIDSTGHVKLTDFGLSRGTLSKDCIDALKVKLEKIKTRP
ncbi:serine/threonine-protein kinase dbf2, partial [Nowakowskiella sp. JEL0078]